MSNFELEKILKQKKETKILCEQKLAKFEHDLVLVYSTNHRFSLEKEIEECQNNISKLKAEIDSLESRLNSNDTPPNPDEIELLSARYINYKHLRDLLADGNWREADRETAKIMLEVANRSREGWLRTQDIKNFPGQDLDTLDRLWSHYSQGHFGFRVQQEIYQSLGEKGKYTEKNWNVFCDRVGWRKNGRYLHYRELTFNLDAKKGHLPIKIVDCAISPFMITLGSSFLSVVGKDWSQALFSRAEFNGE